MGLRISRIDLSELKSNDSIRLSPPFVLPESKYKYDKISNFIQSCESGIRPTGGIKNEDEGEAVSLGGEQIGSDGNLDLSKTPYVSYEFYENTNKGKVADEDILICKDGALTGKTCLVNFSLFPSKEVMVNEHIYILRCKKNTSQKFLFYFTGTNIFQSQIKDLAYKKKAQPGLNADHLRKIKIPLIPKNEQDEILSLITPFEKQIDVLKAQLKKTQEVINKVIAKRFNFDLESIYRTEKNNTLSVTNNIAYRNPNLRSSVRWHKIAPIQKVMYKNNPHIKKLGKYITSTRNGWSPNCQESDTISCVFGVNSISSDSIIKYEDLKYSNETKNNISDFYAQENDLFISRGNTVDLVALASIVKNLPEDQNFIFPDLFIKMELNEQCLNKEYLAYLFNSIVGRFYFKYSSKGKNQTMVKISSDELNDFYLPIPPIKEQIEIVDDIKAELAKQLEIKNQMEHKRNRIKEIIEKALSE